MKKALSIMGLCLLTAASATAQKTVVKEAENAMKSGKPFTEVVTIITPAFTNAETQNQAQTYYVPGKAGFKQYDDVLGKRQIGVIKDDDPQVLQSAEALLGGYEYYMKALPLDSLPDEKGKVKPKYSKEILSTIVGHQVDFSNVGGVFYNAKQFDKAYQTWDIFLDMARDPMFIQAKAQQFPDSTLSDIAFNQGIAAWQANEFEKAGKAFQRAINLGYGDEKVYQYGIAVATNAKDNDMLLQFAVAGNEKFGETNPEYINQIVNYYLNTEKYAEATDFLDKAIAAHPGNAQYYALEGIIYDNQKDVDKAMSLYKKALEIDPDNGLGNFYYGRSLARKAGEMQDAYQGTNYSSYKAKEVDPLYKESLGYLKKAYEVDKANKDNILDLMDLLYYNLNDAAGQDWVKEARLDD